MKSKQFLSILKKNNLDFFTGVPDSLLKDFIKCIETNVPEKNHHIAANEGSAIGIGIGYHLSTNKIPLVYLQNSGLGNCINPLTSLTDPKVYSIPLVLLIGWRGENGIPDEPQHIKQGKITENLLKVLEIPYLVLEPGVKITKITKLINQARKNSCTTAFLVRKNFFHPEIMRDNIGNNLISSREEVIEEIIKSTRKSDIIVSTTGMASRELFELRKKYKTKCVADFYTVGGMGHASQIALGLAIKKKSKRIICIDGDGSTIMHMGGLATIGSRKPKNFFHIIINNGVHGSVGGQKTDGMKIDFKKIAIGCGYQSIYTVNSKKTLKQNMKKFLAANDCAFLEIKVNKVFRKDLGRPDKSPKENKKIFMKEIIK